MTVITRFAPSPTGYLHIGSARTALFNFLYAKRMHGKFLLRIEDTDKARNTKEASEAILQGLAWLGIDWDDEVVLQSSRQNRHTEIALELLNNDKAYYCYCSQDELEQMRNEAVSSGKPYHYNKKCRALSVGEYPQNIKPVVRLKAPNDGHVEIKDSVQGNIKVHSQELDDFILLRSDGTPTYMLAVVVDDYDMGVTHIIRGDDHLTNAARQNIIYNSMDWPIPSYSHIPMINGEDGLKLSKRRGALGVQAYQDMGYLPEAMCNYLLRLGWSHGDDEIISQAQAIEWFNLEHLGKSPSRIDFKKLDNINCHYLKITDDEMLAEKLKPFIEKLLNKTIDHDQLLFVVRGMAGLKQRAKNLQEMAHNALFYVVDPSEILTNDARILINTSNAKILKSFIDLLEKTSNWNKEDLMEFAKSFALECGMKVADMMQIPRIALTGSTVSPSVIEIMLSFGKDETLARLNKFLLKAF